MKAPLALLAAASLLSGAARAQETHSHAHEDGEALGKVSFPTSCRAEVAAEFTRAVALLHSFGYEESRRAFESVAAHDPDCAIAFWGIAMTYYHPIWSPPDSGDLAAGRAAVAKAEAAGASHGPRARLRRHDRRLLSGLRARSRTGLAPGLERRARVPVPPVSRRPRGADLLRALPPRNRAAGRHDLREPEEGRGDPQRASARGTGAPGDRALHDPRLRLSRRSRARLFPRPGPTRRLRRRLRTRCTCRPTSSRGWDSGRSRSRRTSLPPTRPGAWSPDATPARPPSTRSTPSTIWNTPISRSATRRAPGGCSRRPRPRGPSTSCSFRRAMRWRPSRHAGRSSAGIGRQLRRFRCLRRPCPGTGFPTRSPSSTSRGPSAPRGPASPPAPRSRWLVCRRSRGRSPRPRFRVPTTGRARSRLAASRRPHGWRTPMETRTKRCSWLALPRSWRRRPASTP